MVYSTWVCGIDQLHDLAGHFTFESTNNGNLYFLSQTLCIRMSIIVFNWAVLTSIGILLE